MRPVHLVPPVHVPRAQKGLLPAGAASPDPKGEGKKKKTNKKGKGPNRCGHSGTVHYSWWNKHVANPIRESGYGAGGAAAMQLLRGAILEACMLRRTK